MERRHHEKCVDPTWHNVGQCHDAENNWLDTRKADRRATEPAKVGYRCDECKREYDELPRRCKCGMSHRCFSQFPKQPAPASPETCPVCEAILTGEAQRIRTRRVRVGEAEGAANSSKTARQTLAKLQMLYDREINFVISTFWDGGYTWKLGDAVNGFDAEGNEDTFEQAIEALRQAATKHCGFGGIS